MRGCKTPNDIQCRVEYFVKQNTFGGLRVKEFISSTKKIRNLILRWFYTRRNVRGMSLRYRFFFCSCTCVKVLVADAFLKCRFRWKVEIISTFPLRTNVAFFLHQSFLCIHVNKVIRVIIIWLIYSSQFKWLRASTWKTVKYQKGF